jgi:glycosyltransferase involved in cell wall biosynthesis
VNPNAVDPDYFYPGGGDPELRRRLGVAPEEVLVMFVGTFGPWHGVEVLGQAIRNLLTQPNPSAEVPRLRFLLVGEGALSTKLRATLEREVFAGQVIFAGLVPHESIRDYLDASDILVSPHVPMPDGSDFFGSPTKLFEYMAMGKSIVASRLNQIGEVLRDRETALLVKPGDPNELAAAVMELARNPELRRRLGEGARQAAVATHSWKQNAARVLEKRPAATAISREEDSASAQRYALDRRGKT